MFASLLLASRGRPLAVWVGGALAFIVHVVIAVSVGVGLSHLLPARAVVALVAASRRWEWRAAGDPEQRGEPSDHAARGEREPLVRGLHVVHLVGLPRLRQRGFARPG